MDLEQLNKTQIVLLTLLVSFVTSIATGIVTVTLMDQAPPAVTQTINRVVERTVERVVPAEPTETGAVEQTVIEKETTVVVKEDDLITESIEQNKQSLVRFVTILETENEEPVDTTEGTTTESAPLRDIVFQGIGVAVSSDGLIATAPQLADIPDLIAVTADGSEYKTELANGTGAITLLRAVPVEEEAVVALNPVTFVDVTTLKLGQTVIALGGEERTSVATGIIASLVDGEATLSEIHTNISGSIPGSPLVNIFGEVVGIDVLGTPGRFTSSTAIEASMSALTAETDATIETTENITDTVEG